MSDLTYQIGAFDSDNRNVSVTFTKGEIVHTRNVNAVVDENGDLDTEATELRVQEVARGVEVKIDLGVITAPVPDPDPSEEQAE